MRNREEKRLIWRCRRGTRELDEILSRFIESHFDELGADDLLQLDRLLDCQDPQLADWLFNKGQPDDQGLASIVKRVLSAAGD